MAVALGTGNLAPSAGRELLATTAFGEVTSFTGSLLASDEVASAGTAAGAALSTGCGGIGVCP